MEFQNNDGLQKIMRFFFRMNECMILSFLFFFIRNCAKDQHLIRKSSALRFIKEIVKRRPTYLSLIP